MSSEAPGDNTDTSSHPVDVDGDVDRFEDGQPAVLVDRKRRKYLMPIHAGKRFRLRGGFIDLDEVIGTAPGSRIRSSTGEAVRIYRPTLEEYILLMPRGAQIVTPKDIAQIVLWGDIFPGAKVVEAGIGSGALTLGLLRAVGAEGRVIAFDTRRDFANCARNNIEAWTEPLGDRLEIRNEDVHEALAMLSNVDRLVLDLPDPWNALAGAARALRPNGLVIAYSPTIRQIDQLVQAIFDTREFAAPDVIELIQRPWMADRVRLRPSLRIIGHTGFLLRTRRRILRDEVGDGSEEPEDVGVEDHEVQRPPDPLA